MLQPCLLHSIEPGVRRGEGAKEDAEMLETRDIELALIMDCLRDSAFFEAVLNC